MNPNELKNKIAKTISYWLPNRLVYWVIIRAYGYTTVHTYPELEPNQIGFEKLLYSWEYKTDLNKDEYNKN
jgi:hypothetical protein